MNPVTQVLNIAVDYSGDMGDVTLLIYTTGMRKVRVIDFGAVAAGNKIITTPSGSLSGLSRGAYYTVITGTKHSGGSVVSGIKTILIFY